PKTRCGYAKAEGERTLRDLSKENEQSGTTVSEIDVMAVMYDLIKVLSRNLSNGKIVRLGEIGSFQISISSEGADSEQAFHPKLIKNAKILFRPGKDLKDMTKTLTYEKHKK